MSTHQRAVVIGIDGLGGWYMNQHASRLDALCPTLSAMIKGTVTTTIPSPTTTSCFRTHFASLSARTIFPPVSAPGWTAVLCGQTPDQSGITENRWPEGVVGVEPAQASGSADFLAQRPLEDMGITPVPTPPQTLFEQVPIVGDGTRRHLCVVSWGWIAKLTSHIPHLCDTVCAKGVDEDAVKQFVSLYTTRDDINGGGLLPKVAFLHLDEVDGAGHKHGWESDEYLDSWSAADRRIAVVLGHIESETAKDKDSTTLVILCSDHGGSGNNHGANDIRHMEVPLMVVSIGGGSVSSTTPPPPPLSSPAAHYARSLLDIAPTVLSCLGIDPIPTHRGVHLLLA